MSYILKSQDPAKRQDMLLCFGQPGQHASPRCWLSSRCATHCPIACAEEVANETARAFQSPMWKARKAVHSGARQLVTHDQRCCSGQGQSMHLQLYCQARCLGNCRIGHTVVATLGGLYVWRACRGTPIRSWPLSGSRHSGAPVGGRRSCQLRLSAERAVMTYTAPPGARNAP